MVAVRNLTGIVQGYGPYRMQPDVWTEIPRSLAVKLIGDESYEVEGYCDPAADPSDPAIGRIWKTDVAVKSRHRWPSVGVVVPIFNSPDLLSKCLKSFDLTEYAGEIKLILVDNGSTNSKTLRIVNNTGSHRTLTMPKASGFAHAVNCGMASAQCDFYCLLNQDTEVIRPDWLTAMINWMILRPQCGVAGAKLLYPNGTIQHAGIEIPAGTIGHHRFVHLDPGFRQANYFERVLAVTGAVFCIRSEMIKQIGSFDEDYTFSCEDTDFCLRANCLGWEVWYVPTSVVMHHESAVRKDNQTNLEARHWVERSAQKFRREWGPIVDVCGLGSPDALRKTVAI